MGPNNTTVSDVANVWGNRGTQKHAGVWYDGPHESTSGYSNPVHLTYDFGTQIRITAGQCSFAQWGTAGTVTLEGSANGSTGWTTVHQFTAGTTWWRNQSESYTPYTFTVPSASVTAYRYFRVAFLKTGTGFEAAIHSLIITGQAMS